MTDAQRAAIRSACRADYQAHCASVPPGGEASLQCLQKNMSSLSSGCQSAVRAVEASAEPKADSKPETAPAAATAKPAAEPAAAPAAKAAATTSGKKPSSAQVAAIRSACRADYQKTCAGVPTGGAAALNCLEKNKSNLSPSCQQAVEAASGGASAPAAAAATTPGAAP
ncbi:MAG TPA: cysteine rich repeat-containing protein, partial [Ktedonobacterales bacterium]|nr:cysteine rich repeat-containing protein [Ktedonobacterales bacterium]